MATRGLRAETAEMSVEQGPVDVWVDISCTDPAFNVTFVAVAEDLVAESTTAVNPLAAVQRTLRTWRWFWGVDPSGLSEDAALGLFGELWFLDRWAPFPDAIPTWHGPEADRHDFSSMNVAVEVKTTRSQTVGAARHQIASLDQLDGPDGGNLYLFSLQAIPDPTAGNTLPSLVKRIRTRLRGRADLLAVFDKQLALAGWSPAHCERYSAGYRLAAERLYWVTGDFPRLTRASFGPKGLPAGLDEVKYSLNLAACAQWLVASTAAAGEIVLTGLR